MTRYILAGGNDRQYDEYGERLSQEVRFVFSGPIKILSCQFSRDEDVWRQRLEEWAPWFVKYFGEDVDVQGASKEDFIDQVAWADLIYFHGGETQKLERQLEKFDDLESHFEGKIIVGSSAGTNYLSKTYFSPKRNMVGQGSGIVPLNTIVHYGASSDGEISLTLKQWEDVRERMKSAIGDELITLLPEGEFIVVEK